MIPTDARSPGFNSTTVASEADLTPGRNTGDASGAWP